MSAGGGTSRPLPPSPARARLTLSSLPHSRRLPLPPTTPMREAVAGVDLGPIKSIEFAGERGGPLQTLKDALKLFN